MVLILRKGRMRITLNDAADVEIDLDPYDTYSIPAHAIRAIRCLGDETAEALVVVSGDHRKRPVFGQDVLDAAQAGGLGLDAGGFVAKAALLPVYKRAG
jgi:hypothetical protein